METRIDVPNLKEEELTPIITLIGSTKNKEFMKNLSKELILKGNWCNAPIYFDTDGKADLSQTEKQNIKKAYKSAMLHSDKIILVISDNYLGNDTMEDLKYLSTLDVQFEILYINPNKKSITVTNNIKLVNQVITIVGDNYNTKSYTKIKELARNLVLGTRNSIIAPILSFDPILLDETENTKINNTVMANIKSSHKLIMVLENNNITDDLLLILQQAIQNHVLLEFYNVEK